MSSVSVIVLNYNRCGELRTTLAHVLAQTHRPLEVIVADNASTDGSAEMVRKEYPSVRLLALPENIGTHARRKAAELATGDYVMMYDDDSGPSVGDDLARLAGFLDRRPEIAAVCTAVWRTRSTYLETWGWEKYAVGGDARDGYEGLFLHGSGTGYRRRELLESGAFDNALFWGDEEFDAALSLAAQGSRIVYLPSIVTNHRASLANRNKGRFYRRVVRNHVVTFFKFFGGLEASGYALKELVYQSVLARLWFPFVWLGFWDALWFSPKPARRRLPESTRPYLREVRERRYPGPFAWLGLQIAMKQNRKAKVF